MLAAVLTAWLGVAGPIGGQTLYDFAKEWQTLIAALVALAAAVLALWPVWRQVRVQSAQAAMQLLPVLAEEADAIDHDRQFLYWSTELQTRLETTVAAAEPDETILHRTKERLNDLRQIALTQSDEPDAPPAQLNFGLRQERHRLKAGIYRERDAILPSTHSLDPIPTYPNFTPSAGFIKQTRDLLRDLAYRAAQLAHLNQELRATIARSESSLQQRTDAAHRAILGAS